ncbi:efflux RND transporter periplasmic adaptor subunit [Brevibacillus ruminantium]|uniref:Efflux RND transporter periplasmic adaptor subunit n=1 Tax=Brevibacillus ruminantium TaxID=2950604 RepID=A0ABY4WMR6_9BACL|nr:efflux RND transporter periplasmic adaptor subunit [Brevibacillus ruminantium]USG66679.1 efflux RND transporter periplasmic adaptor subunit [Brevibacillus ruminantium]
MKKWIGLSLAALLLSGCERLDESVQQLKRMEEVDTDIKVKTVKAYTVESGEEALKQEISGVVSPKKELSLSFGRSGQISQILVQKGSVVKQGQVLAALDASVFQQEVSAAQGQVASASIRRDQTLQGPQQHEMETQRLQVEKARQNAEKASAEHAQAQILYNNGAISKDELDRQALADKQAGIQLQEQQIRYDKLKQGADKLEVEAANAAVQQANVQLTRARQDASDAVLKAPFSGVIAAISQTESEQTGPGREVFRLVDTSGWLVNLQVDSGQIGSWQTGKKVTVRAADGTEAEGVVTFVAPVLDPATGTYPVEVMIQEQTDHWRGGMTVTCVYEVKTNNSLFVPVSSVGIAEESYYVMKIVDNTLRKEPVTVGNLYGTFYEVLEGVEPGDEIVSSGLSYVVAGEVVKVADE